jgi:hypothetical protein
MIPTDTSRNGCSPDYPRRSRTRNQNDDSQGNAGVVIRVFSKRMASDPTRTIATAKAMRFAPKKFASSAPADAPGRDDSLGRERWGCAKSRFITTKVAIAAQ